MTGRWSDGAFLRGPISRGHVHSAQLSSAPESSQDEWVNEIRTRIGWSGEILCLWFCQWQMQSMHASSVLPFWPLALLLCLLLFTFSVSLQVRFPYSAMNTHCCSVQEWNRKQEEAKGEEEDSERRNSVEVHESKEAEQRVDEVSVRTFYREMAMYERIRTEEEEAGLGARWSAVDGVGNGDDLEMGTVKVPNPRSVSLGAFDRSFSTPEQRQKNAHRLVSLDVFRGLSVAVTSSFQK